MDSSITVTAAAASSGSYLEVGRSRGPPANIWQSLTGELSVSSGLDVFNVGLGSQGGIGKY